MTSDPRSLVVLTFDSPLKAQEALLALTRVQVEGGILMHDAVFLHKDKDGTARVTETVDPTPASAATSGSLWGALLGTLIAGPVGTLVGGALSAGIGAVAAKLIDIGIPDATVEEIKESLAPETTALAVLLSHVDEERFAKELHRFAGAKLIQSTLSPITVQTLRNALREE